MKRNLTLSFILSAAALSFLFISNTPRVSHTLLEVLETLASDTFEGRQAGTEGGELAVRYLTDKAESMGLSTLGRSYEQDFTIFTKMQKVGENYIEIAGKRSPSFQPLSVSLSGSYQNKDLVFVGFGISLPKSDENLIYDDYKNIDVAGKIVIVMTGDPAIGNPDSKFRDPAYISYRTLFYKIRNAAAHGAAGVLLVQDPLSLSGEEEDPFFDNREGGGERMNVLAGQVKINYINSFFTKTSLQKIQELISQTQKPQSFSLNKVANIEINLEKKTGRVSNVMAYVEGSDPELKKEVIVIGAHMDHLGYGGSSSMDDRRLRVIHNGADDNASGTALVMELMRKIKDKKLKRSVVGVLFNAEEIGLLGSDHFVSSWARYEEDYGKIIGMLNFDMVGRFSEKVQVMGAGSSFEWMSYLKEVNESFDQNIFDFQKTSVGSSDHASFIKKEIPSLFFTTGAHDDYHKSSDDSHKIDYSSIMKIKEFTLSLIDYLDTFDKKLTFDPSFSTDSGSGGSRGYGAHLGCVPKFGQSDDIKGVVCTGTTPGSPAQKAGLEANDVLKRIGEIDIESIYDLAFALKYYRAGDKVLLRWSRDHKVFEKTILLTKKSSNKSHNKNHHFPIFDEI